MEDGVFGIMRNRVHSLGVNGIPSLSSSSLAAIIFRSKLAMLLVLTLQMHVLPLSGSNRSSNVRCAAQFAAGEKEVGCLF